jgi:hypothetical protein
MRKQAASTLGGQFQIFNSMLPAPSPGIFQEKERLSAFQRFYQIAGPHCNNPGRNSPFQMM